MRDGRCSRSSPPYSRGHRWGGLCTRAEFPEPAEPGGICHPGMTEAWEAAESFASTTCSAIAYDRRVTAAGWPSGALPTTRICLLREHPFRTAITYTPPTLRPRYEDVKIRLSIAPDLQETQARHAWLRGSLSRLRIA